MKRKDWASVLGEKHGRLEILELAGRDKHGNMLVKCKCDCGKYTIKKATTVCREVILSCGCLQREATANVFRTHGMTIDNPPRMVYRSTKSVKSLVQMPA